MTSGGKHLIISRTKRQPLLLALATHVPPLTSMLPCHLSRPAMVFTMLSFATAYVRRTAFPVSKPRCDASTATELHGQRLVASLRKIIHDQSVDFIAFQRTGDFRLVPGDLAHVICEKESSLSQYWASKASLILPLHPNPNVGVSISHIESIQ